MTLSIREPARKPVILPARLADLLLRALPRWLRLAAQKAEAQESNVESSNIANADAALPWWTAHHPALSFRRTSVGPSGRERD